MPPWTVLLLVALVAAGAPVAAEPTPRQAEGPAAYRDVTRYSGPERFATAAAVSAGHFEPGVDVAYIATGEAFADALAGGPLAGAGGAPILLVQRDAVPDATAAELTRLQPRSIVVLGGPAAVSDASVARVADFTDGEVTRIAGNDRFETAAAISATGFEPGVRTVYVATGGSFADALAGGAAGAATGSPILLVQRDSIPESTAAELTRLQPDRIAVLGGDAVVAEALLPELQAFTPEGKVVRLAGASRFETAAAITEDLLERNVVDRVFVATGGNFPDGLVAAPAAALSRSPLLLTQTECMPAVAVHAIVQSNARRLAVLGSTSAVSDAAASLAPCEDIPPFAPTVDPAVVPERDPLPGRNEGEPPRDLVRLEDEDGTGVDMVADEVVLMTSDPTELQAFVDRWDGEVVAAHEGEDGAAVDAENTYVVRLDIEDAMGIIIEHAEPPMPVEASLRHVNPLASGDARFSSHESLGLFTVLADATAHGFDVSANMLFEASADPFIAEETLESPFGDDYAGQAYTRDAYDWPYMSLDPERGYQVAYAWRLLQIAGRMTPGSVGITVLDGGFDSQNPEYPAGFEGSGHENIASCTDGNPCPWHGTGVVTTAAGRVNNGIGAAGSGGPVATVNAAAFGFDLETLVQAASTLSDLHPIINMSFTAPIPDWAFPVAELIDSFTALLWANGHFVVAAAGNGGDDIETESCFVACWEDTAYVPCESPGVLCVGGLKQDSRWKDPGSNGSSKCANGEPCDIDLFGPHWLYVGPLPDQVANRLTVESGTSYTAPFIAGIAALLKAGRPGLDNADLEWLLTTQAAPSPDPGVPGVVQAHRALRRALQDVGPFPPYVEILTPDDGTLVPSQGNDAVQFSALALDVEDGEGCCTIRWRSDREGLLGSGREIAIAFDEPGPHRITAEATDSSGELRTSAPITVNVSYPPTAVIEEPVAPGTEDRPTVYAGTTMTFRGRGFDQDIELLGDDELACDALTWSGSSPAVAWAGGDTVGCSAHARIGEPGQTGLHTVTLTATDGSGDTATDTVEVEAIEAPPDTPAGAWIIAPEHGSTYSATQVTIPVEGGGYDPNNEVAEQDLDLQWWVFDGHLDEVPADPTTSRTGEQVASGSTSEFTTSDCTCTLALYAYDDDGATPAFVHFTVTDPPA